MGPTMLMDPHLSQQHPDLHHEVFWPKQEVTRSTYWVGGVQCDQIWRNFATLAKVYKSLANFWWFIFYLANCTAHFGNFMTFWANFHCCKWPNTEKQSHHLVTLVGSPNVANYFFRNISGKSVYQKAYTMFGFDELASTSENEANYDGLICFAAT